MPWYERSIPLSCCQIFVSFVCLCNFSEELQSWDLMQPNNDPSLHPPLWLLVYREMWLYFSLKQDRYQGLHTLAYSSMVPPASSLIRLFERKNWRHKDYFFHYSLTDHSIFRGLHRVCRAVYYIRMSHMSILTRSVVKISHDYGIFTFTLRILQQCNPDLSYSSNYTLFRMSRYIRTCQSLNITGSYSTIWKSLLRHLARREAGLTFNCSSSKP